MSRESTLGRPHFDYGIRTTSYFKLLCTVLIFIIKEKTQNSYGWSKDKREIRKFKKVSCVCVAFNIKSVQLFKYVLVYAILNRTRGIVQIASPGIVWHVFPGKEQFRYMVSMLTLRHKKECIARPGEDRVDFRTGHYNCPVHVCPSAISLRKYPITLEPYKIA